VSLAPLREGVALMAPAELAARCERRRGARDLAAPMSALWRDFCRDDRVSVRRWMGRLGSDDRLPHLGPAMNRVLEDREQSRTARQVRALVEEGVAELPALMRRLQELETPGHGAWYGDEVVRRLRDRLRV
jgi:hypothetical protein